MRVVDGVLPAGGGWLNEWGGEAGQLGPGCQDLLPRKGRGRGGLCGRPFRSRCGWIATKLTEALPRVAMAPGRVAACRACV